MLREAFPVKVAQGNTNVGSTEAIGLKNPEVRCWRVAAVP